MKISKSLSLSLLAGFAVLSSSCAGVDMDTFSASLDLVDSVTGFAGGGGGGSDDDGDGGGGHSHSKDKGGKSKPDKGGKKPDKGGKPNKPDKPDKPAGGGKKPPKKKPGQQ